MEIDHAIFIIYINIYYYNDYSCNFTCPFGFSNSFISAQKGYFYLRKWATFVCAFILYFLRNCSPILRNWALPVRNTAKQRLFPNFTDMSNFSNTSCSPFVYIQSYYMGRNLLKSHIP